MSNRDTQLRTFLSVARLGSFRRAAEDLFVTQAAVTTRIKGLEEWLGFEVFRRHRRGAELTEQGERFIEYARVAMDTIEHGRQAARRASTYRAHYRFMSQYLLLDGFAVDWLDWMKQRAPDVSLSIDSGHSGTAARDIASGLIDLAVGYQRHVTGGVVFEPLFEERLVLVTSHDRVERWRENYISIGWDDTFDDEHRRFVGELDRHSGLHAEFIDLARTLLMREPGSAYVVERSVLPLIDRGRLLRVPDAPVIKRPAHVIYPAKPTHPDVQDVALEGLRTLTGRLVGGTDG